MAMGMNTKIVELPATIKKTKQKNKNRKTQKNSKIVIQ